MIGDTEMITDSVKNIALFYYFAIFISHCRVCVNWWYQQQHLRFKLNSN